MCQYGNVFYVQTDDNKKKSINNNNNNNSNIFLWHVTYDFRFLAIYVVTHKVNIAVEFTNYRVTHNIMQIFTPCKIASDNS